MIAAFRLKTVTLTMVLLMLLSAAFVMADLRLAAAEQDGDYTYQVDMTKGQATITSYTGPGGNVVIPATLGGYSTVAIGQGAFQSLSTVNSVTLPQSLLSIGNSAFGYCSGLSAVTTDSALVQIGANAFQYCISLSAITLGQNVTNIGNNAFYFCIKLTSITIPDSVNVIGDEAFGYCTSLTSATMGTGVTAIGSGAFDSCTALSALNLGPNLKSIGVNAFSHCTSITTIVAPDTLTSIGAGAFSYSISLTSVNFGRNIAEIGERAFAFCTSLTSMTFLGLFAPTIGQQWIVGTSMGLRGHAAAASDFPEPGGNFNGLTMGMPIPSVPAPPRFIVATPGNRMAILNWTAPTNDGGANVSEYWIYRSLSTNDTYNLVGNAIGLVFTDSMLTNGVNYSYKISAVNAIGVGPKSASVAVTAGTPTEPRSFNAVAGEGKVTLTWLKPADESGSQITSYDVYRVQNGVPVLLQTVPGFVTEYSDTTAEIGVKQGYMIQPVNSNGAGSPTIVIEIAPKATSTTNAYILLIIAIIIVTAIVVVALMVRKNRKIAQKNRDEAVTNQFDPHTIYPTKGPGDQKPK